MSFWERMTGIFKTYIDIHHDSMAELERLNQINKKDVTFNNLQKKDINELTELIIRKQNQQNNDLQLSAEIKIKELENQRSNRIIQESLYILLFSRYETNLEKLYGLYAQYYPGSFNHKHNFSAKDLTSSFF